MSEDTFSARLRGLRDRNGWNARIMAEKTGIPKQTLESYMSLKSGPAPGLEALKKIALGLEVSLDWLVFGSDPVGDDTARLVRLCARAGAMSVFERILAHLMSGETQHLVDGKLLGLTVEEWASEVGWQAGERAQVISEQGTSRHSLRIAEKVVDAQMGKILEDRLARGLESTSKST